ncbi:hypothetical protein SHJG_0931 [Streptomyces hygroscopicus subsp. jinggangensis 5008]|nr:hypothetical protein SHJG_0931 [Streptomyces hygroscopicus subsp. jinggangensis 5008]AGF60430.1 hypothetical protein SHJGH_0764 [Streptomyces hygroscopicus subsp. jinggangensis TL01]
MTRRPRGRHARPARHAGALRVRPAVRGTSGWRSHGDEDRVQQTARVVAGGRPVPSPRPRRSARKAGKTGWDNSQRAVGSGLRAAGCGLRADPRLGSPPPVPVPVPVPSGRVRPHREWASR